jgi:hypothetical protein
VILGPAAGRKKRWVHYAHLLLFPRRFQLLGHLVNLIEEIYYALHYLYFSVLEGIFDYDHGFAYVNLIGLAHVDYDFGSTVGASHLVTLSNPTRVIDMGN